MGVASPCQPLQLFRRPVPVLQRKCLVPDDLPQFPAGIGLTPYLLRFVMVGQVSVLEGDFPQTDTLRLLDDAFLICRNSFSWDSFFFSLGLSW